MALRMVVRGAVERLGGMMGVVGGWVGDGLEEVVGG